MYLQHIIHSMYVTAIIICDCIIYYVAVAILFAVLTGVLTVTRASHNVYHVQPDDTCNQQSSEICHTLQFFAIYSDLFFTSNAMFLFAEGEYFHSESDLIVQNFTDLSLIGTGSTNDSLPPKSVIRCLSHNHMHFYNVVNLLIKNLTFDECGSYLGLFTQRSGYGVYQHYYWASIFFNYCIHLQVINVVIYDPIGYAIVGHNVIGNSSLENF